MLTHATLKSLKLFIITSFTEFTFLFYLLVLLITRVPANCLQVINNDKFYIILVKKGFKQLNFLIF